MTIDQYPGVVSVAVANEHPSKSSVPPVTAFRQRAAAEGWDDPGSDFSSWLSGAGAVKRGELARAQGPSSLAAAAEGAPRSSSHRSPQGQQQLQLRVFCGGLG